MDEKTKELLEQCLFERAQVAYEQMLESNPRLKDITHEAAALSGDIERSTAVNEESKALVQRFLSLSSDADYEYQRYLYIQGAKDCVAALRELGVIK
jgi:hypothetical protein